MMEKNTYEISLDAEDGITVELELTPIEAVGLFQLEAAVRNEHERFRNYEFLAPTMTIKEK